MEPGCTVSVYKSNFNTAWPVILRWTLCFNILTNFLAQALEPGLRHLRELGVRFTRSRLNRTLGALERIGHLALSSESDTWLAKMGLWWHILSPLQILSPGIIYTGTCGIYCRSKAYMKFLSRIYCHRRKSIPKFAAYIVTQKLWKIFKRSFWANK